jgi:hypothetical protein
MTDKDELAALRKELNEVKAALAPAPAPIDWEKRIAAHQDEVHRMREGQANSWMPPNAIREMVACEPKGFMHDVALRDARAPQSGGMIPNNQQVRSAGGGKGTGWVDPVPLSNPPGVAQADRLMDAADKADRVELAKQ